MIKFIDNRMEKIVLVQDSKVDALETRHTQKIVEFRQLLNTFDVRTKEMYTQNLQILESMEIERAHAKKERADSVKERVQSREFI